MTASMLHVYTNLTPPGSECRPYLLQHAAPRPQRVLILELAAQLLLERAAAAAAEEPVRGRVRGGRAAVAVAEEPAPVSRS
jgi:hypothetical protein